MLINIIYEFYLEPFFISNTYDLNLQLEIDVKNFGEY